MSRMRWFALGPFIVFLGVFLFTQSIESQERPRKRIKGRCEIRCVRLVERCNADCPLTCENVIAVDLSGNERERMLRRCELECKGGCSHAKLDCDRDCATEYRAVSPEAP